MNTSETAQQKKEKFFNEYLKGRKIENIEEDELKSILKKAKSHHDFYKKITEEPNISKESMRFKESSAKMKALLLLKDKILESVK